MQSADHPFHCGVLLDPWMHSVYTDDTINVPVLNLQSETFHWQTNLTSLETFHRSKLSNSPFMVIKSTAHQDFSDFPILFPRITRKMGLSGDSDPSVSFRVWSSRVLEFLNQRLDLGWQVGRADESNNQVLLEDEAFQHLRDRIVPERY